VAKPDLGTKRVCPETGRKFYDLNKDPVVSPFTGQSYPRNFFDPVTKGPARAAAAAAAVPAAAAADEADLPVADSEVISLEDAEAETTTGKKAKVVDPELDADDDVEVETDDADDSTFLATDEEEEGGDVSDIIGDGIEKEDET